MTRTINIGSIPVVMAGNAATSIRYKQVFGEDLLALLYQRGTDLDMDTVYKLAYIMALQGSGDSFTSPAAEGFLRWLEQFDTADMLSAMPEVMGVWIDTQKVASVRKKKAKAVYAR